MTQTNMDGKMNVQTNLLRADIIRTYSVLVFRYKFIWLMIVGAWIYAFITINSSDSFNDIDCGFCKLFSSITVSTGYACIVPFISIIGIFLCAFSIKKGAGGLGNHIFDLSEEGLRVKTEVGESLTKWQGITSLIKTKKIIIVSVSASVYYSLPKRDFRDEAHFTEFWEYLSSKWKANRK